jgi:hypothetical protein
LQASPHTSADKRQSGTMPRKATDWQLGGDPPMHFESSTIDDRRVTRMTRVALQDFDLMAERGVFHNQRLT